MIFNISVLCYYYNNYDYYLLINVYMFNHGRAQVVGWPPIRSYRKNNIQMAKKGGDQNNEKGGLFVKVSMDGAPYLRKVDLNMYKGYRELREGLDAMFKCFPTAKDEFAIAYEDKDSDLMLVGDVPWE